MILITWS